MAGSDKAKQGWRQRLRDRRERRRQTARDRAKQRRDEGVAGSALADLSRRHPDQMGGGGG
jgi:hypothetical protein